MEAVISQRIQEIIKKQTTNSNLRLNSKLSMRCKDRNSRPELSNKFLMVNYQMEMKFQVHLFQGLVVVY
jgi:hypothetical protein